VENSRRSWLETVKKWLSLKTGRCNFFCFGSTFYDAKEKEKHSLDFAPDDTTRDEVKKCYHRLMIQRKYPS